jgi:hypothetical protein
MVLLLQMPAALLTPYGVGLWNFVGDTVSSGLPQITEWHRPMLDEAQDVIALVAVGILAMLIALGRGSRRDPVHVAIMLLLVAAGLYARRHLPLALVGLAILGAPAVVATIRAAASAPTARAFGPIDAAVALMAASVLVIGIDRARCVRLDPATTPQRAVDYLARAGAEGNLVVLFDWGMYAIWHLAPSMRVSMDGRATTVYPAEVLRRHVAFLQCAPGWRAGLDDADVALLSPRFPVYRELAGESSWRLAYEDDASGLFVRRGSMNDERLARTARPTEETAVAACLGDDQPAGGAASSTETATARWSDG